MKRILTLVAVATVYSFPSVYGKEPAAPASVSEEDFKDLLTNSPFTRSLNLSDSLVLTGIATIGDESIATVLDTAKKESYVVSANTNAQGWRMVEIDGERSDLDSVTAKISLSGGEVIAIRFNDHQLKPGESKPAGATSGEGTRPPQRPDGGKGGKGGKGKMKGEKGGREGGKGGKGAKGSKGGGGEGGGQSGATRTAQNTRTESPSL